MEEKRKRAEEVDPAKKHDTREQERREMEKDAPESKEADKVKGKTNPALQLASDTEDVMDIKHVTEEVMRGCVITLQDLDRSITNDAGIKKINEIGIHEEDRSHYTKNHWGQTTTKAPIKITKQQIPCIALIEHGSEVIMMSSKCYAQGRWPIDKNHGSKKRVATEMMEDLFGACSCVKVTMGDVSMDQIYYMQDG